MTHIKFFLINGKSQGKCLVFVGMCSTYNCTAKGIASIIMRHPVALERRRRRIIHSTLLHSRHHEALDSRFEWNNESERNSFKRWASVLYVHREFKHVFHLNICTFTRSPIYTNVRSLKPPARTHWETHKGRVGTGNLVVSLYRSKLHSTRLQLPLSN